MSATKTTWKNADAALEAGYLGQRIELTKPTMRKWYARGRESGRIYAELRRQRREAGIAPSGLGVLPWRCV